METIKSRHIAIALLTLFLLLNACNKHLQEVSPVQQGKTLKGNGFVYYLPKTVLNLQFTLIKKQHIPGPYSLFAGQFLGIQNSLEEPQLTQHIHAVRLTTAIEADLSQPLYAQLHNHPTPLTAELTHAGLIIPANHAQTITQAATTTPSQEQHHPPHFLDLSTKPFIDDQQNIFYTVVKRDTAFVRIPVQRSVVVKRSLEEKAKQAADIIFTLRNKRIEVATGEIDPPQAKGALESMLREIDKLEAQYLALFIGQTYTDTTLITITHIPERGNGTTIPCRYSPEKGVVNATDISASPIVLNITPEWQTEATALPKKSIKNAYYFRSACISHVQLTLNGQELLAGRFPILQLGEIQRMPVIYPKEK